MKFISSIDSVLSRIEGALLVLFLSGMILMSFLQVVLRNFFGEGIVWADILLRHLVLWIGFLGAALAVQRERHIAIDAITRSLPDRWQDRVRILTNLFAASICVLLLRASLTFLEFEIEDGRSLFLDLPEWYSQIVIPGGFALMAIHFVIRAAMNVRGKTQREGG